MLLRWAPEAPLPVPRLELLSDHPLFGAVGDSLIAQRHLQLLRVEPHRPVEVSASGEVQLCKCTLALGVRLDVYASVAAWAVGPTPRQARSSVRGKEFFHRAVVTPKAYR